MVHYLDEQSLLHLISIPHFAILWFQIALDLFNITALLYLLHIWRSMRALHLNLWIMLVHLSCICLLGSVVNLWKNALSLAFTALIKSGVGLFNVQCWICRILGDAANYTGMMAVVGLGIERCVATYSAETYEGRTNRKATLGVVVMQWIAGFSASTFFMVHDTRHRVFLADVPLTCSVIFTRPKHFLSVYAICFATIIFLAMMLMYLQKRNKEKYMNGRLTEDLSTKFQTAENINVLRFLVPLTFSYALVYATSAGIGVFAMRLLSHNLDLNLIQTFWVMFKLAALAESFFITVVCVLFFYGYAPLNRTLQRKLQYFQNEKRSGSGECVKIIGVFGQSLGESPSQQNPNLIAPGL